MSRPISLIIHPDAMIHNLSIAKHYSGENKLFAVVKANAYGHRIENSYDAFKTADGFALLEISEALKLRSLGCSSEILLLEGIFTPDDLTLCEQYGLTMVIHSFQQIEWLSSYQGNYKFNIFLKLNSGMNRLGFKAEQYTTAWNMLHKLNCIKNIVHTTHFSDADDIRLGIDGIEYQYKTFQQITHKIPGKTSVCNSAALLRHSKKLSSDYCRAGIMLYGCSPDYPKHSIDHWNLRPTMTLKSEIISIQCVKAGETIGYGSTFTAEQDMQIGIVACGYADGYPRSCPSGTPILVNGQLTHTIGRVSMDMLCVDLTNIRNSHIGTEVTMWGHSSTGSILPIELVAHAAGTIGYELMCKITARVPIKIERKTSYV
ncbi:alanine racemase [Acinetobacter radioresistens]|uniref:alanine racemase n=1 Tax=Acinetobacter radioresistens TaxID=40216 RepID=UPI0009462791|nr:alanine racemase [Acinetobacter radioresistens]